MLRILFLNTWSGDCWEELEWFYRTERFDILCLTEVHHYPGGGAPFIRPKDPGARRNPICSCQFDIVKTILPGHDGYYAPAGVNMLHDLERTHLPIRYGNAMFIKNDLVVSAVKSGMAFGRFNQTNTGKAASCSIQGVIVVYNNTPYIVVHFHGLWTGNGKGDTPERFEQSKNANAFLGELRLQCQREIGVKPKIILGGDFNLNSATKALEMMRTCLAFEGRGVNLNQRFGITDTRTSHYRKTEREADFVLISGNVKVHSFTAPAEPEVSDHRPLILECV